MKLVLRILIFNLCIITTLLNTAQAAEITQKYPDNLDSSYIQIESLNKNAAEFSVINTLTQVTEAVKDKFHSLLEWTNHTRTTTTIERYDRLAQFGTWINDSNDHSCLNTRAKVLVRDALQPVKFNNSNHCRVDAGIWKDPYTDTTIHTADGIQIDHLVPLKNAFVSGANKWSFKQRCLYANYLGYDFHLLSVSATENMKKSDRAPDKYMPPEENYACTYVRNWLSVKMIWNLTMTVSEANQIKRIINEENCSLNNFKISQAELAKQKKFMQENQNLCENENLAK